MKTAIKVISLRESSNRREAFEALNNASPLDGWEYFDGLKSISEPLRYDEHGAVRRFGRSLSQGELGCYASHYKCWEWLVDSEFEQAVIIEDDTIVDWAVIDYISKFDFKGYGIEFFRLFSTHPVNYEIVKHRIISPHHHLIRLIGISFGTQCYLITKSAARKFISIYNDIYFPVDWVVSRYWEHGVVNYMMCPSPVIERFAPSAIGDSRHSGAAVISPFDRIFRLGWRFRDRISRFIFDNFVVKRHPLGKSLNTGAPFLAKELTTGSRV